MKKIQVWFKDNVFYVIITVVGIAYILTGMSDIIPTNQTLKNIISVAGLTAVVGWLISAVFGQSAIKDGFNDNDLVGALNTQGEVIESIDDNIDKLDSFCEKENEAIMIRKRTRTLKKVGITYKQFETGDYGSLVLTKRRKKAIRKASEIGFGYLTTDWLLSDIDDQEERNSKRVSIKKYIFKQNIKNIISKVLTGALSGFYILEPFAKAEWNILIWRLFFFALMLIFGYVRYITDFNFVTRDYRKSIINKTNYLIKFRNTLSNTKEQPLEQ